MKILPIVAFVESESFALIHRRVSKMKCCAYDTSQGLPPPPEDKRETYAKAGSVPEEKYTVSQLESLEAEYWGTLGPSERKAEQKILLGLAHLGEGNMQDSLEAFDEVVKLKGPKAYVWQRGIPLYYLGEYESAADYFEGQARLYIDKFGDAPSSDLLWAAASRAQLGDPNPSRFAGLARDGNDQVLIERNPVLRCATALFEKGSSFELNALRAVTRLDSTTGLDPLGRFFYGHFYAGLWMESVRRDSRKAHGHLRLAVSSPFGAPDDLLRKIAVQRVAGQSALDEGADIDMWV